MYRILLKLFLHGWIRLPGKVRWPLIMLPLVIGAIVYFFVWDWIALAIGGCVSFILLVLPGGPSESEKKGYHF
ncbi:MAG TPA: hypothetical protein VFE47_24910 [Tepidisphaeraceae bacterium]|nr:hypothetical protein [Tepidisphaeraceae bacterium]